jgi:ribose transport system permease protein
MNSLIIIRGESKAELFFSPMLWRIKINESSWIWLALTLLVALSAVVAPGTLRPSSILATLPFASMLAIIAVGQTIVVQQRGLDMSSAGVVAVASILVAKFAFLLDSGFLGVIVTIAICALVGVINGILVARVNISPIVATLATGALVLGTARLITGGSALPVILSLQQFSNFKVVGFPLSIVIAAAMVAVVSVLIGNTIIGRRYIAVGANPWTAQSSGINVVRYQVGAYAIAAVCYAIAGALLAGFVGYASPTAGSDYLLPSIAAVVVGGTPFTGGRGSVVASGAAALFMVQLGQMVLALGAGPAQQLLVQAVTIVVATSIRRFPFKALTAPWMHDLTKSRESDLVETTRK